MRIALLYLAAMALGLACGFWGGEMLAAAGSLISSVFIRLFKFISIPIIAVSIISTLSSIAQSAESGRIFKRTVFYTLLTTILAASLAAALYLIIAPANVELSSGAAAGASSTLAGLALGSGEKGYADYALSIIPDNALSPFLSANVLSVLLIAAAVGIAIAKLPRGSAEQRVLSAFFSGLQSVLFTMVRWIIALLPIGLFGFFTVLAGELKAGLALGGLGAYFGTVIAANLLQMTVVLPLLLLMRGIRPLALARRMAPALALAFFSKSSAGTLPLTLQCSEAAGVSRTVSRFVLPLCTTINMNGCAAFILITVAFVLQNAGAALTPGMLALWVLIATIAAVGNAGVPMGCFFLSASLLASMNAPLLLLGLILPVYAVIDAVETALNVWSDSSVAAMVHRDLERQADSNRPAKEAAAEI